MNKRVTEILIALQASALVGLLYVLSLESRANAFMGTWFSENLPWASILLNGWVLAGFVATALTGAAYVVISLELGSKKVGEIRDEGPPRAAIARERGRFITIRLLGVIPRESLPLLFLGTIALSVSVVVERTLLAFIGLGFLFLAFIPIYLGRIHSSQTPSPQPVESESLRPSHSSDVRVLYAQTDSKEPSANAYVLPGKTLSEVLATGLSRIQRTSIIEKIEVPGRKLLDRMERVLDLDFSGLKPSYLTDTLSRTLTDKLKLARKVRIESAGDRFRVRIEGTPFSEACERTIRLGPPHDSLGCELCSAIALALAKSSGKVVIIEDTVASSSGERIETTYRILKHLESPIETVDG